MNVNSLEVSLLFLEPKQAFFDWLAKALHHRNPGLTVQQVYFQQEDPVWLIPYIPRFRSQAVLDAYLMHIKPKLLEHCLSSWAKDSSVFPDQLDAATFDAFFVIHLRNHVSDVREVISEF